MHVNVSLKLNYKSIQAKIDKALANSPVVKRLAFQRAYGIFIEAKRMMLQEFDRHPITQELRSGPQGVNISKTLDGYGNLFSFIGFYAGDEPTERLRTLLDLSTQFHQTIYRKGTWYFRATLPDRSSIESVTDMPWEHGNSWAYAVESFISGLSNYMYVRYNKSRSGMGIQLPYENWEDLSFNGRPYITEILRNFRQRVNKEK